LEHSATHAACAEQQHFGRRHDAVEVRTGVVETGEQVVVAQVAFVPPPRGRVQCGVRIGSQQHPDLIEGVDGIRHLLAGHFEAVPVHGCRQFGDGVGSLRQHLQQGGDTAVGVIQVGRLERPTDKDDLRRPPHDGDGLELRANTHWTLLQDGAW
jgi:hypothetical protein